MTHRITRGFRFTNHAIDRLYERHPHIFQNPDAYGPERRASAYAVLDDSLEDKAVKNNSLFMVYIHETYGYDREFHFFINGDVLFLGVVDSLTGDRIIITTLVRSNHMVPHLRHAGQTRADRFSPTLRREPTRRKHRR